MWTKLDDALIDHRKVWAAGARIGKNGAGITIGFFAVILMWANKHLTNGFIPEAVIMTFPHVTHPRPIVNAMVEAGFLERVDGGYVIHDFKHYNPSADEVKASREWDRRRKELYRSDPQLVPAIRKRDQDLCRYCGQEVNWNDRRGPHAGQYDHVEPRGPNTLENVVVSCRRCNSKKSNRTPEEAGMLLLEPGTKAINHRKS